MKKLLINGCFDKLISLSKNYTQYLRKESVLSTSSITDLITNGNEAVSKPAEDTAKTVQP